MILEGKMRRSWGPVLLVTICLLVPAAGRDDSSDALILSAAREIMESARYCGLVTRGEGGETFVRTMDPFPPDDEMIVRLGTRANTRKVAQIRRDPRVVLYYFDREAAGYVTISGRARLIDDPAVKSKWWKPEWVDFYDDGHRGADYIVIQVHPDRCEVVSRKHGVAAAPKEWKPATIYLPPGREKRP
jgi:general stress protein 26